MLKLFLKLLRLRHAWFRSFTRFNLKRFMKLVSSFITPGYILNTLGETETDTPRNDLIMENPPRVAHLDEYLVFAPIQRRFHAALWLFDGLRDIRQGHGPLREK